MHFHSLFVVGAILVAVASVSRAENSPAYDSWAKFKPGSSVTLKSVTEASGQKSDGHMTFVLQEVTKDKAVVQMRASMTIGGKTVELPAQKIEIPAKGAGAGGTGTTTQTQTLTIAGKQYKCALIEVNTEQQGVKLKSRTWTCPNVPGQMVKMETSTEGAVVSKTSMELEKVEMK